MQVLGSETRCAAGTEAQACPSHQMSFVHLLQATHFNVCVVSCCQLKELEVVMTTKLTLSVICALVWSLCSPLAPRAFAEGNTSVGTGALESNSTGAFNSALGFNALFANTSGQFNTAIGSGALLNNTIGVYNSAFGANSLYSNTTGGNNTATGAGALLLNTTGDRNTAIGTGALQANSSGHQNSALGFGALASNTTGYENTAVGLSALASNITGCYNTATGYDALQENTTSSGNTANGYAALKRNTSSNNTAIGATALQDHSTGGGNTAIGAEALTVNTAGIGNTAVGYQALDHSTGDNNLALGVGAGRNLYDGSHNVYVGSLGASQESQVLRLGCTLANTDCAWSDKPITVAYIAGISGSILGSSPSAVYVTPSGQLGVLGSSRRFKTDIESIEGISEKVNRLRPVRFRYRKVNNAGEQPLQYGLIAEEVAEVFPELVGLDETGQPSSVHYQFLGPLLLAELQTQQQQVEKLRTTLSTLEEQIESLQARIDNLRQ